MKYFISLFLITQFAIYSAFSQRGDCKPVNNQAAIRLYNKAYAIPPHRYKEAIQLLDNAIGIKKNYIDAHYMKAEIYYNQALISQKNQVETEKINDFYRKAEHSFLKVVEICPAFQYYKSFFFLAEYYYMQKEYEKAKHFVETFLEHNNDRCQYYDKATEISDNIDKYFTLINNPVPFEPEPLKYVCSPNDEYLPLMSPDEEILLYTYREKDIDIYNPYGKSSEKLMISKRDWSDSSVYRFLRGEPMPAPFNDGRVQGGASITIDNNHIFITICEYERVEHTSVKNCDIFTSDNVDGKWTPLRRMDSNINGSNTFEGMPAITADGRVLFFASARKGGYGGIDIYKSKKLPDGTWGKAQNLGPVINTEGDDKTPFIHSDSRTLYFSSNGRFGLGGFDVFFSQYEGDGKWTEPQNIGYPINTANDELGLVVSADGRRIFFSSRSYTDNENWDIYTAELHEKARPKRVLFVKGNVTDMKGNKITNAEVDLKSLNTKQKVKGMVDEFSGKYAVAIPIFTHHNYLLTVEKDDYIFKSMFIDSNLEKYTPPTNIDFKLDKVEKGKAYRLNNVQFSYGSHKLNQLAILSINQLVKFMKTHKYVEISLHGHTDNRGTTEFNLALSQLRVQAVRRYMIQQGINSQRIDYKGFGSSKPIVKNTTEAGRKINRRVEFIIKGNL